MSLAWSVHRYYKSLRGIRVRATLVVRGLILAVYPEVLRLTNCITNTYGNNYGNLWHFCKNDICPDPIWKPVNTRSPQACTKANGTCGPHVHKLSGIHASAQCQI